MLQLLLILRALSAFAIERCFADEGEALLLEMNCGPTKLDVIPTCAPEGPVPHTKNRPPPHIATSPHKTGPDGLWGKSRPNIASTPEFPAPTPHRTCLVDDACSRKSQKHEAPSPGNASVVPDRDSPWHRYRIRPVHQENSCIAPVPGPLVPATSDIWWRIARSKAALREQGIPSLAAGCGSHRLLQIAQIIFRPHCSAWQRAIRRYPIAQSQSCEVPVHSPELLHSAPGFLQGPRSLPHR